MDSNRYSNYTYWNFIWIYDDSYMIHFVFSDKDDRYLSLKCDYTPDEYIEVYEKDIKKYVKHHVFELLKKHINLVDPACYLSSYTGPPFTQDFIFDYTQLDGNKILWCSIGLWQDIYKFLKSYNLKYDGLDPARFKRILPHTFEQFKEIVDSWSLSLGLRPYQYEAAYKILEWKKSLSQLATRAGKTLMAYVIFRYSMEYLGVKKILMIVPSIDLVKQAYNDFNEYAEFFNTECIWSGGKLVESSNLTVGTFQSLIKFIEVKTDKGKPNPKYNPHFFDDYDCVFVDEVHRAKAAQIKNIISQPFMNKVKIAFGMTGTLPKEKTIEHYCLHSLIGAKIQQIKPRDLMDEGYISDVEINQYRLNYKNLDKQKKLFIRCAEYCLSNYVEVPTTSNPKKKERVKLKNPEFLIQYEKTLPLGISMIKHQMLNDPTYSEEEREINYIEFLKDTIKGSATANALLVEKMMVHFMDERIDVLCNDILKTCEYNTLILAHHTEYLNYIYDKVKEKCPDKIVCLIYGETKAKERDKVKQILKENNNCILVASYGCVGTGITLSNLCFGVLFESFKSEIINMQSIGRGLGLSKYKDKYIVYDFIDCFNDLVSSKSLFRQGKEKIKIYEENKYDYKIIVKNI